MAKPKYVKTTNDSYIGMIEDSLRQNWDFPAFTDYGTDCTVTYGDVAKQIARLHLRFKELGLRPGDKIALCDKNSTNWAIAFLAITTYGAVVVPILADFNQMQINNIYVHSESKLMICARRFTDGMNIKDFSMFDTDQTLNADAYCDLRPEDLHYFREVPDDLALMSYTSGSTGNPKGVMLPYRCLWSNMRFADEVLNFTLHSNTIALLPMAHMYGFAFDFMYEFCIGCHIHFLVKPPSPQVIMKAYGDIKPVIMLVVPMILEKVVQSKIFPMLRTQRIKTLTRLPIVRQVILNQICYKLKQAFGGQFYEVIIGGAAFSKDVEDFLKQIRFPFTVGYGMTECGPIICYEDWKRVPKGSCGKAVPRMQVKIDSPDPQNVPGEILAKGMNVMLGYYKNPEETEAAIDKDGWLHTGDLGTIDKDGYVYIRGRKKTMLLGANGQNIYPEEIEDVIVNRSIFEESVVVQRGEKLVALVYISEKTMEAKHITRESIEESLQRYRQHINESLPKFCALSALEVMEEEFEKTPKRSIRRYLYK